MYINLLILLFTLNHPAVLKSRVVLEGNESVCFLSYSFPEQSSNRRIQYQKLPATEWEIIQVTGRSGIQKLTALTPDKGYRTRLIWAGENGEVHSQIQYFRSYAQLTSGSANHENIKILNPAQQLSFETHALLESTLNFRYKDKYLKNGNLKGEIYDANHLVVGRFFVAKTSSGIYHLDVLDIQYNWETNTPYSIKLFDDLNPAKWLQVLFRDLDGEIVTSIGAIPTYINCDSDEPSAIQFFGNIDGGTFPYDVTWTVSKSNGSELLHGPEQSQMVREQETVSSILVEYQLPYVVTLSVFDGCGLFSETNLLVTCSDEEEGDNTLLVENLPNNQNTQPNTGN